MLTAPKAHVIRDGEVRVIPVEQVVADEVLEISLGGQVVVDGEVLAAEGLEIDESLLTGESRSGAEGAGRSRAVRLVRGRRDRDGIELPRSDRMRMR